MPTYVLQRHYQTELAAKVSEGLSQMFGHLKGAELMVHEVICELDAPKPFTKANSKKICAECLKQAKAEGDTETVSFDVVPLEQSIGWGES